MGKNRMIQLPLWAGIVIMCLPILICTLYTYPVQDDFFNTWNVSMTMREGHTAFGAALLMALKGWTNYSGYYFSLFLTYFSDALVQCDIGAIRCCQFVMALVFYASVFLFIRTMVVKVFRYEKEKSLPVIFLFFIQNLKANNPYMHSSMEERGGKEGWREREQVREREREREVS